MNTVPVLVPARYRDVIMLSLEFLLALPFACTGPRNFLLYSYASTFVERPAAGQLRLVQLPCT